MLLPGTHRFKLAGGHPVLDFLNTLGGNRLTAPREDLETPEDLVSWGLQSGWL
ncbi:MAG: ABATE domain-containing protein, partial [Myxococcaceae bacterium]